MAIILTNIAISDGKVKRSSLEVLTQCRKLAQEYGHTTEAVIIHKKAAKFVDEIKKYGPNKIYTVDHPIFENHLNVPVLRALDQVIGKSAPDILAFASTESTKDILGYLGAKLDASVLPDVASFKLTGEGVTAKRPVMAAKILSNTEAKGSPVLVSVRAGAYDAEEAPGTTEVEAIDFEMDRSELSVTLLDILGSDSDEVDLSEAEVIVSAGRGVKDAKGKELISKLASVLNAGIGASRALTESGMYDPSKQIGQTGKVVSPQLYIAVGISGAIQHVAGMANSKVIVAINKDPDAPIFDIADYGIVGDLYEVLPPFIEELKKVKG